MCCNDNLSQLAILKQFHGLVACIEVHVERLFILKPSLNYVHTEVHVLLQNITAIVWEITCYATFIFWKMLHRGDS